MLKGRNYPGRSSQLHLEGDPDRLLELSDLLMKVEERSEISLDSAGVETSSSKHEAPDALRAEIRNEGSLLIKHEESTLHIEGSREIMERLARNIRFLAEETIKKPVRSVQNHLHVEHATYFWVEENSEALVIGAVGG